MFAGTWVTRQIILLEVGNGIYLSQIKIKACGTPIIAAYFGKVAVLSSTEVTKRGNEGSGEDH